MQGSQMYRIRGSKLLVIDDEKANTDLLKRIFSKERCDVLALNDSQSALETIRIYEPDLIILDVMMPGKSGFELIREIKIHAEWKDIPIIFLTALMDRESCITGLEAGAADYVSKPFSLRELRARVFNQLQLKKQNDFLRTNIRAMSDYDLATGLPNRKLLGQLADAIVAECAEQLPCFAICQTLSGHQVAQILLANSIEADENEVYRAVVRRMTRHLPANSVMGLLEEGRFGILIHAPEPLAYAYLKSVWIALNRPFLFGEKPINLPFHFGMNPAPFTGASWRDLAGRAELALAEANRIGREVVIFESRMDQVNGERLRLSQALYASLEADQFHLCYQPQFNVLDGKLSGFEALLRWTHPEYGVIPPDVFIPLAEANGMINDLGLWVVESVCKTLQAWDAPTRGLRIAINVSALQLQKASLSDAVCDLLERYRLKPCHMEIELTESTLANPACDIQIQKFLQRGFSISIDDFGTGYSNLSYLNRHQFKRVKIDRSFVQDICGSRRDVAIVQSIIAMSEHLDIIVIAEGVETAEQLALLKRLGCDEVQGYLLGKPLPFDAASALVRELWQSNGAVSQSLRF